MKEYRFKILSKIDYKLLGVLMAELVCTVTVTLICHLCQFLGHTLVFFREKLSFCAAWLAEDFPNLQVPVHLA
jgi:hypothetical protein